ncbi:Arsenical resistance operon repressor [Pseudoalteromonas luteoviolacea B = ATCC 29581]|nr:Arsenical resistance operon repressor [Pseudoalteromonas luteoviolacea B = ATCC 29581]
MKKVLFVCSGNSVRAIMAEALLNHHGHGRIEVFSAGAESRVVNPNALAAIENFGLLTENLHAKCIHSLTHIEFDYVITLEDKTALECDSRIHGKSYLAWDIPDPLASQEAKAFEHVLQMLNERIQCFVQNEVDQVQSTLTPLVFYKALADEIRLKTLLILIVEQEVCVCELMVALNEHSQPKVSRHLAQLKKLGILSDRKYQQWVFYSFNSTVPKWMKNTLSQTLINEPNFIAQALTRLRVMGDRPSRVASCCN